MLIAGFRDRPWGIAHFHLFSMVAKAKTIAEAEDAFIQWWQRTQPDLERYARALGTSEAAARDLAQDVALSLIRDRSKIDSLDRFRAFAFKRLAWLRLADLRRSRTEVAFDESLHNPSVQPHDPYVEQLHAALARAIEELPRSQRAVVEARLLGHDMRQIASRLGISEATARSHFRHAKLALAEALAEHAQ